MIWQNISAMSAPESADAPVNRPSMKKWVVLIVVLGALIGLGTMEGLDGQTFWSGSAAGCFFRRQ